MRIWAKKYRKSMAFLPKARHPGKAEAPAWQRDMGVAFRTLEPLLRHLGLDPASAPEGLLANPAFPVLVPRSFADRMARGDWRDPLLRQVLPLAAENLQAPGFRADAVGDLPAQAAPGLLHKYASRALLMVSPHCAVHCRYCFRREFPYGEMPRGNDGWEEAWEYLEGAEGVDEIVLSGGDPLFLDDRRLERILGRIATLPRIRTVRFHSRLPVVLPSRVDGGFSALLEEAAGRWTVVMVVHANHPAEIAADCPGALEALRRAGALVLNQAVLLRGVNDDADTLAELSRRLLRHGVLPYYLHQLDRVSGTAHFEATEEEGLRLVESLRGKLPGYGVPRYVREVAGEPCKRPLGP
jgi:EF-P beta-lysylation protein EpmB